MRTYVKGILGRAQYGVVAIVMIVSMLDLPQPPKGTHNAALCVKNVETTLLFCSVTHPLVPIIKPVAQS